MICFYCLFLFILGYQIKDEKKQIRAILLFEFKMERKAAETVCNINQASGKGPSTNIQLNIGFKNFVIETKALKMCDALP
jgi:hypothetical protein